MARTQRDGLACRTVQAVVPPQVDDRLTEAGRALHDPLAAHRAFGAAHLTAAPHR